MVVPKMVKNGNNSLLGASKYFPNRLLLVLKLIIDLSPYYFTDFPLEIYHYLAGF
jgi:hypothetical protein